MLVKYMLTIVIHLCMKFRVPDYLVLLVYHSESVIHIYYIYIYMYIFIDRQIDRQIDRYRYIIKYTCLYFIKYIRECIVQHYKIYHIHVYLQIEIFMNKVQLLKYVSALYICMYIPHLSIYTIHQNDQKIKLSGAQSFM